MASSTQVPLPAPRAAVPADADEVLRLAAVMYAAMGVVVVPEWYEVARTSLLSRLGEDVAVVVVDDATRPGALAACGAGVTSQRLPGPTNLTARVGYLQWVCTDEAWRRRGLARAVTTALLEDFRRRDVWAVELHATPDGEGLYRSLGFTEGPNPGLRLRLL
ncbi:GNAT family N-acetyltransferase [Quadrisphaera setariae]|uniref:GNAT family N-acetyltransferase n=1 Tax=Quadrisphaera setariae TaxID=2593304 RepID=A0A5C8ZI50_9ACTN|nr:GNAT family N-acetyltransferase [Quadrisphaera setariae]TXR56783.1 GNAT family N-acetyltransferase [Quadrisphaera setariae]